MDNYIIMIVSIFVLLVGGSFAYSRYALRAVRENYEEDYKERLEIEQEYLEKVRKIAQLIQPDLERKTIVNGHYIKVVRLGIQVTTYYSYLILIDSQNMLQVISYQADTKEAIDCGIFPKERVVPIDLYEGAQTNYKFLDENLQEKFVVQTFGLSNKGTYNNEYELQYPQLDSYSKLRDFFGLTTDVKQIQIGKYSD